MRLMKNLIIAISLVSLGVCGVVRSETRTIIEIKTTETVYLEDLQAQKESLEYQITELEAEIAELDKKIEDATTIGAIEINKDNAERTIPAGGELLEEGAGMAGTSN